MRAQKFLGGLLLSLFLFSFSGATDWDKALTKLVSEKTKIDVIKYISARDIANAYRDWKSGSWTGKLFKFGIRTTLWTGFFYLSSELLLNWLDQQISSKSLIQSSISMCLVSDNSTSVISPGYYVNNVRYKAFVSSDGIVSYYYGTFSSYVDANLHIRLQNGIDIFPSGKMTPDLYNQFVSIPSCPNYSLPVSDVLSVLQDPANYPTIQDLIDQSPATVSPREIPNSDAYPLSSSPNDQIKVTQKNDDGTQTVATPNDTTIEQDPDYDPNNPPAPSQEDYSFSAPDVSVPDLDTNIDIPEKKSISNLISNAISNIPALNILKQVKIQGSGSCSFNIPVSLGNASSSGTLDFCQFADVFSIIGGFILAFAHLYAIMIVFKGD